ncbi:helix-turn-helix transcriptional regulator [Streptomyces flaveolus]|uniref:helix-turn-helix transcriptional regulator n=1 Tax=Streptomyces flaveolus TaxID=67297 RepID=UPI0037F23A42
MPDEDNRNRPQPTVTRILRQARQRIDPRSIPEAVEAFGPRGRRGLTQREVAQLLGVSPKWYRNLELGKPLVYSKGLLEKVRRILALDEDEWEAVWQLTQRGSSAIAPGPPASRRVLPPAVQRFLDVQPWPVYICDHRWDLVAHNRSAAHDFPWMLDKANVMVWALTHVEARTRLVEWETDWAPALMARLQLQAELRKGDPGLQAVIRTVEADAVARRLWGSQSIPVVPHFSVTHRRRMLFPRRGNEPFTVSLLTAQIDDMPSCHMTALVPS